MASSFWFAFLLYSCRIYSIWACRQCGLCSLAAHRHETCCKNPQSCCRMEVEEEPKPCRLSGSEAGPAIRGEGFAGRLTPRLLHPGMICVLPWPPTQAAQSTNTMKEEVTRFGVCPAATYGKREDLRLKYSRMQ